jgi:FMN phosphatase YigB (HAD superfamily)
MHDAADLGAVKPHPEFSAGIEARLNVAPEGLVFIDDRQSNVDAALARGWKAALWTATARLIDLFDATTRSPPTSRLHRAVHDAAGAARPSTIRRSPTDGSAVRQLQRLGHHR